MNNLQINTTQNVNLNYAIVGIGERIVAFFIDALILYLYYFLVDLIGTAIGYIYDDGWTQRGIVGLIALPAMFYSLLMHIIFNGRTVGKMMMKMRVVSVDGSPVRWSNYLIRWMLRLVDILLFMGSIGILTILFSEKSQRLGDAAAGTVVISTKTHAKVSHTILEEVTDNYVPKFTNVTLLTDKDVRLIKETFEIAQKSNDFKTMKALKDKVDSILQTNSDLYDKQYLDTILKDYNYFTQKL
ncbi:RDD family protein [Maribacter ulvicola]|uniref:Uncharacterized membrane protein YckC, RDD family n=1 Tax=Maribacter ulvicola TaxID=228959 RepID=A0A1N6XJN0_9FLAO|nr:RDD family protein [Maribacter ulvicola]SIR02419.1 Uncharacterized membrane protein YckC, RDD family [Maribacter ulvicola]